MKRALEWIASKWHVPVTVGALVKFMNIPEIVIDAGVEAAKAVGKAIQAAGSLTAPKEGSHGLHRDLFDRDGLKYRIEHPPAPPDVGGPDR